jgi:outer membrane protein
MMVASIRHAFLALALVPAIVSAQALDTAARPISVDEAVRIAQQYSPFTVASRNGERAGEAGVRASLAQYIPTLLLSYTSNQQGGTQFVQGTPVPVTGLPWTYSRGLTSSLTIFDGNQRWFNYRAATATLDAADATDLSQRYAVALSVKIQYYAVLAAREQEAAGRRQLEQAQAELDVSAAKMVAGAATRADSLSAAILVQNAKLAILTAQNNLRNANAGLTRLIASPVQVTAVVGDTSDVGSITIGPDALANLVANGPSVVQAVASLQAAHALHRAATTPYLPTLSANASYGQNPKSSQTFDFGAGPTTLSTRLGFTLSYTVFQNYSREQSLVLARIAEDNADATLRDTKAAAQQNLVTFLSNYETAQQTIELELLTIQSADENLRVVRQRYNLGAAAQVDVITAEAALDAARAQLIQARLNARTAKANIEALIGRDLK